jgi:anti-sigma factor RsiW
MERAAPMTDDELLARYLLGELSDAERDEAQERLFADPEFFERLLSVENDLIDSYARDALPRRERELVETHLLASAQQRRKLRFARALSRVGEKNHGRARPHRFIAPLSIAAALVLALGFAWSLAHNRPPDKQVAEVQPAPIVAPARPAERAPIVATFLLTPGALRDATGSTRVEPPKNAALVRFQLELQNPGAYRSFAADLKTAASGRLVSTERGLTPQSVPGGQVIAFSIPVGKLTRTEYEITLAGESPAGRRAVIDYYYFHAVVQ